MVSLHNQFNLGHTQFLYQINRCQVAGIDPCLDGCRCWLLFQSNQNKFSAKEQIPGLRDDIAFLKGEKGKPKIHKSTLEDLDKDKEKIPNEKRHESAKRSKTAELVIHETICLTPKELRLHGFLRAITALMSEDWL